MGNEQEGPLPIKEYLDATVEERSAIASGAKSIATVAAERRLARSIWRRCGTC